MEKSGDLLSPTNYVCFYTLLFPQYCTGNTPVVSNCLPAQCCKHSLCSCSEMCDFPRDYIAICIYTVALITSSFLYIPYFIFFLFHCCIIWKFSEEFACMFIFRSITLKNIVCLWNPRTVPVWLQFLVNNYSSWALRLASFNLFNNCFISHCVVPNLQAEYDILIQNSCRVLHINIYQLDL